MFNFNLMLLNFKVIFNKHTNKIQKSEKKNIYHLIIMLLLDFMLHPLSIVKKKNTLKKKNPCEPPIMANPLLICRRKKKKTHNRKPLQTNEYIQ